ncbi:DUF6580 family putative transport protein [Rhodopirellula sp. MGV]|uniref:DUF6580 family putative transport protein n=1 Tax=Rhodopirellula sp. MGV TaxID=2023130 RepID=UPI000B977336|nr:DUF6580 family putative transport protein [Rhodopirellula sp. MGV]OYP33124.1 hypothetical protein CGZ80_18030 [Rhodopirellula sp. MGV]PNY35146.1 hypothetical protein C2E31_19785 [Rhodopirellula baltica]
MIYVLSLIAVASRFLPHPPNFACIGALGLFAGCYVAGRRAYLLPLLALLISDIIGQVFSVSGMGFYRPEQMAFVYAGMLASVAIGRHVRSGSESAQSRVSWLRFPFVVAGASTTFFLLSNFGVWLGPWYTTSIEGLIACYTAAIPFFQYTIAGDFFFAAAMFGAMEASRVLAASPARRTTVTIGA